MCIFYVDCRGPAQGEWEQSSQPCASITFRVNAQAGILERPHTVR
jgi:hypothetical protein